MHTHRDTYLSIVLTLTCCLLTVDLWARLVDQPVFAQAAEAQVRTTNRSTRPATKGGVGAAQGDAVAQRKEIIALLKQLGRQVDALPGAFAHTPLKVEVVNAERTTK